MLERDRRRAAHRRHAEKRIRREWREKNEKWVACANHGLPAATQDDAGDFIGTEGFFFFPSHPAIPGSISTLICVKCVVTNGHGVWRTNTNVIHP